jgi:hypothetical protein
VKCRPRHRLCFCPLVHALLLPSSAIHPVWQSVPALDSTLSESHSESPQY